MKREKNIKGWGNGRASRKSAPDYPRKLTAKGNERLKTIPAGGKMKSFPRGKRILCARGFRKLHGGWRKWSEEGEGESSLRFHVKYDRELTDSYGYGPETEPALFLPWSAFFSQDPISSTDHLRNIVRPPPTAPTFSFYPSFPYLSSCFFFFFFFLFSNSFSSVFELYPIPIRKNCHFIDSRNVVLIYIYYRYTIISWN